MHDDSYVQQMAGAFRAIKDYVDAAVARAGRSNRSRKGIKLNEWRVKFTADASLRRAVFRSYLVATAVIAAYRETTEKR